MAENAKVSDALWKAIVTWCGGSTKHDCGWIFRQIWSGETYYKTTRLHGPLFLYMKHLQVSGPCTKFCLLTSELANANWESLCQMFVCWWWFIFRMHHLPVSGLQHGFMRKEEYIAQGDYFIFHLLLSILIPIILCHICQKYGIKRGIFYAMNAFVYMTISLNFQGVCLFWFVGWLVSLLVCLFVFH